MRYSISLSDCLRLTFPIWLSAVSLSCSDLTTIESVGPNSSEEKGFYLSTSLWTQADIPVCWEELSHASDTDRERVQQAITDSWQAYSPLTFTGWGACEEYARGIRIAVRDSHPHVKKLGRVIDGMSEGMVLNMDFQAWGTGCNTSGRRELCIKAIAVHEFGHAIGIAHEQNRADTPDTCNDAPQGTNGDVTVGDWDAQSVMNYCNQVYVNNGILSQGDIATVQAAYAFLETPQQSLPTVAPVQPQPTPGAQRCQVGTFEGECTSGTCRGAALPRGCADSSESCCIMVR